MKVKLTRNCNYYAQPHLFHYGDTKEVGKKLGDYLVSTGYFEEVKAEKSTKSEEGKEKK